MLQFFCFLSQNSFVPQFDISQQEFMSHSSVFHMSNINTLRSINFTYCHAIVKYGIIFKGNLTNGGKICTLRKKIVRIVFGAVPYQYIRVEHFLPD